MDTETPNYHCQPDNIREGQTAKAVDPATPLLAVFGLGPRKCEDCGTTFTVPPYMDCADWIHCEPCTLIRFKKWIVTDEGKDAARQMQAGWTTANDKLTHGGE